MIIWIVSQTDGGHDDTHGRAYTRPSEARLELRQRVAEIFRYGAYGRKLITEPSPEPNANGWHEFAIESTNGDSVILAATHVVGSSYDWPLQPGQVAFAERMMQDVINDVMGEQK